MLFWMEETVRLVVEASEENTVPPMVALPLVCRVPAVVLSTPIPNPPVTYPLPPTERRAEGEVVPRPKEPFAVMTEYNEPDEE